MSKGLSGLRAEIACLGRALRAWPLYAVLALAVVGLLAAWQVPSTLVVDLGGPNDDAYVSDAHTGERNGPSTFYAKEPVDTPAPPFTYRWSGGHSRLVVPGWGSAPLTITLRLSGARPAGLGTPPAITATVRGQVFPLQTTADLQDYALPVGAGTTDPVVITLDTPTFRPPGDNRDLGVLVDRVTLTPAGTCLPPVAALVAWLSALVLLYLILYRLLGTGIGAGLGTAVGTVGLGLGLALARPEWSLLAADAPALLAWTYALLVGGTALTRLILPHSALRAPQWIGAAFAFGFALRYGGMLSPQFLSSDLTFHAHNLARVLGGTWVFPGYLPDGTVVPYPPGAYLLLAPLAAGQPDLTLVLRWGGSLLEAATVFPLAWVAYYLSNFRHSALRTPHSAQATAWAYALLPSALVYFSAGNYSNLIAQSLFVLALPPWVALLIGRPGWRVGAGLAGAFTLTFLGHYGMLIAASTVVGVATIPLLLGGSGNRVRAAIILGALAVAGLVAGLLYYGGWLPEMGAQIAQVLGGGTRSGPALDLGALLERTVRRLGNEWGAMLGLGAVVGWLALLSAQPAPRRGRLAAWIGGVALVGAGFALLEGTVGDSIRYPLLLAPWVALGAGWGGALLARRGRAGPVFVAALAALALVHLLTGWVRLVLTAYH